MEYGGSWDLSYVGIPYHLDCSRSISIYRNDDISGRAMFPLRKDYELIRAIRNVRPYGPVRILVNPAGLVLTKVSSDTHPQSEDDWQPIFVGSINPNLWFEEE